MSKLDKIHITWTLGELFVTKEYGDTFEIELDPKAISKSCRELEKVLIAVVKEYTR